MTTTTHPGAGAPFPPGSPQGQDSGGPFPHPDSHGGRAPSDHDPEAKALLRRYLSDIHSFREMGNQALRALEARLASLPHEPSSAGEEPASSTQFGRAGSGAQIMRPSLPETGDARLGRGQDDPGLEQRLKELSAYLHADLTKENAGRAPATGRPARERPAAERPARPQRPRSPSTQRIPTLPVLDRAWFEQRFAMLRTSIDQLAEQVPIKRIEALEAQFRDLMDRLTAREAARDPRPLQASLKELAAYLADSREWSAANEQRMQGVEDRLDRLSSLVAKSHAAISATAKGLELVAKGTGETLARSTADMVMARIGGRIEGWNTAGRIDQLGREVAHLSAQSRHQARSTEDRLDQIQAALKESSKAAIQMPAGTAKRSAAPPGRQGPSAASSRNELESYLNQPIDLDEDYDSEMIAAAQNAARIADGPARNVRSQTGPVRYQIPYGEFLPDEHSPTSRLGLIVAVIILLLAGATMLFLKMKEWTLVEPRPAVSAEEQQAPLAPESAKPAKLAAPHTDVAASGDTGLAATAGAIGTPVVTGSTPAAPPLGGNPLQLWVASTVTETVAPAPIAAPVQESSFRKAAVKGDLEAQFSVGQHYLAGEDDEIALSGGDRLSKAVRWFRRAAEGGHAPSQYRLATLYELGQGVPRDLADAEVWYERAARQGHVKAMHNLAVLAASSKGKAANYLTAVKWFREAADYGLVDSQFNLGVLYERGLGVPQDFAEAYRWFSIAARQSDDKARQRSEEIARRLSIAERHKADRLIGEWTMKMRIAEVNRRAPEPPVADSGSKPAAPRPAAFPTAAVMQASWKTDVAVLPKASGSAAMVADAQRLLKQMGYDPGPIDGIPGQRTRNAVRHFQRQTGLAPTGEISEALIVKMAFLPL